MHQFLRTEPRRLVLLASLLLGACGSGEEAAANAANQQANSAIHSAPGQAALGAMTTAAQTAAQTASQQGFPQVAPVPGLLAPMGQPVQPAQPAQPAPMQPVMQPNPAQPAVQPMQPMMQPVGTPQPVADPNARPLAQPQPLAQPTQPTQPGMIRQRVRVRVLRVDAGSGDARQRVRRGQANGQLHERMREGERGLEQCLSAAPHAPVPSDEFGNPRTTVRAEILVRSGTVTSVEAFPHPLAPQMTMCLREMFSRSNRRFDRDGRFRTAFGVDAV